MWPHGEGHRIISSIERVVCKYAAHTNEMLREPCLGINFYLIQPETDTNFQSRFHFFYPPHCSGLIGLKIV